MKLTTPEQAKALCIEAHKGQWRRPTILLHGPGTLITDRVMSIMMYSEVTEPAILPNGNKLTYCRYYKQWNLYEPYHTHPCRVSEMMNTPYRKMLAYLHDVSEDCDYELITGFDGEGYLSYYIAHKEHPMQYEISQNFYIDLGLLTKDPNLTYKQNIRRIKDSGRADPIAVKIADNCDNLSTGTDKQKKKYLTISLPILLEN